MEVAVALAQAFEFVISHHGSTSATHTQTSLFKTEEVANRVARGNAGTRVACGSRAAAGDARGHLRHRRAPPAAAAPAAHRQERVSSPFSTHAARALSSAALRGCRGADSRTRVQPRPGRRTVAGARCPVPCPPAPPLPATPAHALSAPAAHTRRLARSDGLGGTVARPPGQRSARLPAPPGTTARGAAGGLPLRRALRGGGQQRPPHGQGRGGGR